MGAVSELARVSAQEPPARPWAELEARHREECAAMLRDARRHFEQRVAREQTAIENVLAAFERDFDAWLARESRGESSPKPDLSTLFDLWLERGAKRNAPREAIGATESVRDAAARERAVRESLDAEAARNRALELRLEEERASRAPPPNEPAAALMAPPPRRRSKIVVGCLVAIAALIGAAQLIHRADRAPRPMREALDRIAAAGANAETRGRRALAELAARGAREEALDALLAADKDATIARVVAYDPAATRAALNAIAPPPAAATSIAPAEAPPAAASALDAPSVRAAPSPPDATPIPPPSTVASKAPAYRDFDNRDIVGAALAAPRKSDLSSCAAACRSRENCAGYSFDRWNRLCRLKAEARGFRLNPRMTSGLRDDIRPPRPPAGALVMERYPSKAFPGAGYRAAKAEGPDACESACRDDGACVAFTFRLDEATCHLFETTGEYFSNALADSGGKRQN